MDERALLEACVLAARDAGAEILKLVAAGYEVETKSDLSPVTICDRAAEAIILRALAIAAPGVPVIAEEEVAAGRIPAHGDIYFLVDPLDGTKEFITGGGDFTVNIGLMVDFKPVMGIIFAPVSGELYYGAAGEAFMSVGDGAEEKISVRKPPAEGITVVASKRHGDPERLNEFLKDKKVAALFNRSSSLKFCALASGQADYYPRLGPTSEWDTAAGEAILRAAGGAVTMVDGSPFLYGKADKKFLNPEFVAFIP